MDTIAYSVDFDAGLRRLACLIAEGRAMLRSWRVRVAQRRALVALDDRLLRDTWLSQDTGLLQDTERTRREALAEARKPFWRP